MVKIFLVKISLLTDIIAFHCSCWFGTLRVVIFICLLKYKCAVCLTIPSTFRSKTFCPEFWLLLMSLPETFSGTQNKVTLYNNCFLSKEHTHLIANAKIMSNVKWKCLLILVICCFILGFQTIPDESTLLSSNKSKIKCITNNTSILVGY